MTYFMKVAFSVFVVIIIFVESEDALEYLKFPSDRKIPGKVPGPQHFALLQNENIDQLPEQFSICSSMSMDYFRGHPTFLIILKDDLSRWIILDPDLDLTAQKYILWFDSDKVSNKGDRKISLRPWTWSHICMTVDLANGDIEIMMNGVKTASITIKDKIFRENRPETLHNRMLFGDWTYPSWGIPRENWEVVQSESPISNVHVYSRLLTDEEMLNFTGDGACDQHGNFLAWEDMEWELHGNASIEKLDRSLCSNPLWFLFLEELTWPTCMDLCPKINKGRAPGISNMMEVKALMKWSIATDINSNRIWASYSDQEEEGIWKDFYTSSVHNFSGIFMKNQPNGERSQNCLSISSNGGNDEQCDDKTALRRCICEFKESPILKLRGLCPESNFDTHYTLYQGKQLSFKGLKQTTLDYDTYDDIWKAKVVGFDTKGISEHEKGNSILLGKHLWQISNDSKSCNRGEPYSIFLKLTGCEDWEFTCNDGQCINMEKRCDQISQCKDKSDEIGCSLISMDKNYNKHIPPFSENEQAKVNVSMSFLSINGISEIFLTIEIKYTISLEWYETDRMIYHNLKEKLSSNALSEDEMYSVWTPFLIYINTDDNEGTRIKYKLKDVRTTMAVTREGNFSRSLLDSVDEIEIFKVRSLTLLCQ